MPTPTTTRAAEAEARKVEAGSDVAEAETLTAVDAEETAPDLSPQMWMTLSGRCVPTAEATALVAAEEPPAAATTIAEDAPPSEKAVPSPEAPNIVPKAGSEAAEPAPATPALDDRNRRKRAIVRGTGGGRTVCRRGKADPVVAAGALRGTSAAASWTASAQRGEPRRTPSRMRREATRRQLRKQARRNDGKSAEREGGKERFERKFQGKPDGRGPAGSPANGGKTGAERRLPGQAGVPAQAARGTPCPLRPGFAFAKLAALRDQLKNRCPVGRKADSASTNGCSLRAS